MLGNCQKCVMLIRNNYMSEWHLDPEYSQLSTCNASKMTCFVLWNWHLESISLLPYALNLLELYVFSWAVNPGMHKQPGPQTI